MKAASALDYQELARRRLPRFLFDYVDGGSFEEVTLRRNTQDLEQVALRQRVLRDVSSVEISTELFGRHVPSGDIGDALALLSEHKMARFKSVPTAGRPSEIWTAY